MDDKTSSIQPESRKNNYLLHIFLFLVTVFTTSMAGAELATARSFFHGEQLAWAQLWRGLPFSLSFLGFLTVHEFGHYLTAVYHRVKCSLPYYIPIFIPFTPINIGSFGAVIRIREVPPSRRKYFDIGVAGPLAGFVVSVGLLVYGFTHLPPMEELVLGLHPEYIGRYGGIPSEGDIAGTGSGLVLGGSLLFDFLLKVVPTAAGQLPPSFEMMHYPYIFVGFLTLFFTALNLLPIGQLDGGHVTYGLFGKKWAGWISRFTVLVLLVIGGTGLVQLSPYIPAYYDSFPVYLGSEALKFTLYVGFLYFVLTRLFKELSVSRLLLLVGGITALQWGVNLVISGIEVNGIWLLYSFLAVRVIGVDHPAAMDDTPLDLKRKVLGWLAILIFILCFSPAPLVLL